MKTLAILTLLAGAFACGKSDTQNSLATDLGGAVDLKKPVLVDLPLASLGKDDQGLDLPLTLSPGNKIVAHRTRLDHNGSGEFSWTGKTDQQGIVVITSHGNTVVGTIVNGSRTYRISKLPDGKLHLEQLPALKHPNLGGSEMHGQAPTPRAEDGPIEIIAAYTQSASDHCPDIETVIRHAVDLTNVIAEQSGLDTRFHLSYAYRTEFDESPYSMEDIVDYFAGTGDTKLNEIHQLRNQHFADIAVLFVYPSESAYDGLSRQTMADADSAFSVVKCSTVLDYYTMTHEIGHQLGLNDDWDQPDSSTFKYGYGYTHDSTTPDRSWRTVMSNGQACTHDCPLIPYWSNPSIRYPSSLGDPTGVVDASDDARVIKLTAGAVSHFREGHPQQQ